MGTDDFFKKRRAERKKRKYEYRQANTNSFLIVTEGEKTEPLYFKGIQKKIKEKMNGRIDIVETPVIDIYGKGCGTGKLIETTEQLVKDSKVLYQNVWIVFDKDDFEDFDEAIRLGKEKGYQIAWSNQSFEYWLYLHFNYGDTALHRDNWYEKLDEIFKQYCLGDGRYRKNYEEIYDLVDTYDGVNTAIKNAKRRMAGFCEKSDVPSKYDPGTMVYRLVEQLKQYLDE